MQKNNVDSIVLAGGFGKRLKKHLPDLPKALAPINNTPFIDLLIDQIKAFKKISKVILALGYKAKMIQNHCQKTNYGVPLEYSIEKTPLGTGGAFKKALHLCQTEHVLVLNGDSFLNFNFSSLFQAHIKQKADITLVYTSVDDVSRYGQIIVDPLSQKICSFKEKEKNKKSQGFISCGFYLVKKNLFKDLTLEKKESFSLEKEAFPLFLEKKRFFGFFCKEPFIDIGTKESFLESQTVLSHL